MLMIRTRAYSSSCLQLILVYLHPFHRNSVFLQPKIAPKIRKNPYFKVIDVDIF